MVSFESYILKQQYQKVAALGDKLSGVDDLINWHPFRKIVSGIYDNTSPKGGRPNTDPITMIKLLLLQAWYGLPDQELEYQVNDRVSFLRFLGVPDKAPDYSTVWRFRERPARAGKDIEIWGELQRTPAKNTFACFGFNLDQLATLRRHSVAWPAQRELSFPQGKEPERNEIFGQKMPSMHKAQDYGKGYERKAT